MELVYMVTSMVHKHLCRTLLAPAVLQDYLLEGCPFLGTVVCGAEGWAVCSEFFQGAILLSLNSFEE